jgi:hypothetical protein
VSLIQHEDHRSTRGKLAPDVIRTAAEEEFQLDVPAELVAKKYKAKAPLGSSPTMHETHCFARNLNQSPYELQPEDPDCPTPGVYPPIARTSARRAPIVDRLVALKGRYEPHAGPTPQTRSGSAVRRNRPKIGEIARRSVPFAEQNAQRIYRKEPFDIAMLSPERKRIIPRERAPLRNAFEEARVYR